MNLEPKDLNARDIYRIFVSVVSPKPIAWVSTVDLVGRNNLAPFSMYTMLSTVPAVLGFGVSAYHDGGKKDTIKNVEATNEFVINLVTEELSVAMNITSSSFPPEVSEFEKAGLTPVRSAMVAPPRVGQSPISLECRVLEILRFGSEPMVNSFIVGEVLLVHLDDKYCPGGVIDSERLKIVGRLGAQPPDLYCRTTDTFIMKRPES
jgi:flavin reductase (DIM6/NTAB) family NADH-FMN oxidoreductase RutF